LKIKNATTLDMPWQTKKM